MFLFRFLALFCCALMLPNASVAHAQSAGYPEWQKPKRVIFGMPYLGHAVKPGETGMITEVLKMVFKDDNIDFEHRNLPYKRALEELSQGTVHCTLALKNKIKNAAQAKTTIAIFDLAVAYRAKDAFKETKDLEGENVAYLHGFDIQSLLTVKIRPQLAYDLTSAMHMLDRGHVRYVLDDDILIKDAILEAKLPTAEFKIKRLMSLDIRPIFTPTEDGRLFRDIYDRRMEEMIKTGKLQEILRANGLGKEGVAKVLKANGY